MRKAVWSHICNNGILTVTVDSMFPVWTWTHSVTRACGKGLELHISWDAAIQFNTSSWMGPTTLMFRHEGFLECVRNIAKTDNTRAFINAFVTSENIGDGLWKLPVQNGRLFLKNDMSPFWPYYLSCKPRGKHWCQSNRHAQQRISKFLFYIHWCERLFIKAGHYCFESLALPHIF